MNCHCGRKRIIVSREDIIDLEAISQKFEQEDGVLKDVKKLGRQIGDYFSRKKILPKSDEKRYTPYCEIKFDMTPSVSDIPNKQCTSSYTGSLLALEKKNVTDRNIFSSSSINHDMDNHVIFKTDSFHHKHNIERLSKKSYDGNPTSKEDGSLGPSFIGENEDSVSEVFKVKRTIVVKADKSIALNNASSSFSEHQPLKRLKRFHPEESFSWVSGHDYKHPLRSKEVSKP